MGHSSWKSLDSGRQLGCFPVLVSLLHSAMVWDIFSTLQLTGSPGQCLHKGSPTPGLSNEASTLVKVPRAGKVCSATCPAACPLTAGMWTISGGTCSEALQAITYAAPSYGCVLPSFLLLHLLGPAWKRESCAPPSSLPHPVLLFVTIPVAPAR